MKVLILWHHYDGGGRITNADSTDFNGTLDELQDRIKQEWEENKKRQKTDGIRVVPHQLLLLEQ